MRCRAGYSLLDQRSNGGIPEELTVYLMRKKLAKYEQKLLNHISIMGDIRQIQDSLIIEV
jgi:hypothetical protein